MRECDAAIKQRFAARLAALTQAFADVPVAGDKPLEYTQFQNILRRQAEQARARAA